MESWNKNIFRGLKSPILKIIFNFVPSKKALKIVSLSKCIQQKLDINISTYIIFSSYLSKKIDVLNHNSLSLFLEKLIIQLKKYSTEEIVIGLCYCIKDRLKNNDLYTFDIIHEELFPVALKMRKEFAYMINLIFSEKYLKETETSSKAKYLFVVNSLEKKIASITFSSLTGNNMQKLLSGKTNNDNLFNELENVSSLFFEKMKLTSNEMYLLSNFTFNNFESNLTFNMVKLSSKCFELFPLYCHNNLKSLELISCHIGDKLIPSFCFSDKISTLTVLNLKNNSITDQGVEHLTNSTFCYCLKGLNLSQNKLTKKSISFLSKGNFPELTTLDLSNNNLENCLGDLFLWSKQPNKLKYLNISKISYKRTDFLGKEGIINNLKCLNCLNFSKNEIGTNELKFFVTLSELNELDLSGTDININKKEFGMSFQSNIQYLYLSNNNLDLDFVKNVFLNVNIFPKLTMIDLFKTNIDNAFVEFLIQNKSSLSLLSTNIDINQKISIDKKKEVYKIYSQFLK